MTELAEIVATLTAMRADFREHVMENKSAHAEMQKELVQHYQESARLRKTVFGNGNAGLVDDSRDLKRFVSVISRVTWYLATATTLGAGALVWEAVRTYLRTSQ